MRPGVRALFVLICAIGQYHFISATFGHTNNFSFVSKLVSKIGGNYRHPISFRMANHSHRSSIEMSIHHTQQTRAAIIPYPIWQVRACHSSRTPARKMDPCRVTACDISACMRVTIEVFLTQRSRIKERRQFVYCYKLILWHVSRG